MLQKDVAASRFWAIKKDSKKDEVGVTKLCLLGVVVTQTAE